MNVTILDIETLALPEAEIRANLEPFDPAKVKLGVLKDHDKIRAKLAEAEAEHGNEEVARGALDPTTGTLAIIGFIDGAVTQQWHGMPEAEMLRGAFSRILDIYDTGGVLAGWNIRGFDLPFLVRRAWILGVAVPQRIFHSFRPRHPWSESVVDLMEVYAAGDYQRGRAKLATALRDLGLPPKSGSGADFGALWASDREAALLYNRVDLACEMAVAKRLLP